MDGIAGDALLISGKPTGFRVDSLANRVDLIFVHLWDRNSGEVKFPMVPE